MHIKSFEGKKYGISFAFDILTLFGFTFLIGFEEFGGSFSIQLHLLFFWFGIIIGKSNN